LVIPVSGIKKRINSDLPIFDDEIFGNNYEEKSTMLREIIAISTDNSINIDIIIESLEEDKDSNSRVNTTITKEVLLNILNSANSESDRF